MSSSVSRTGRWIKNAINKLIMLGVAGSLIGAYLYHSKTYIEEYLPYASRVICEPPYIITTTYGESSRKQYEFFCWTERNEEFWKHIIKPPLYTERIPVNVKIEGDKVKKFEEMFPELPSKAFDLVYYIPFDYIFMIGSSEDIKLQKASTKTIGLKNMTPKLYEIDVIKSVEAGYESLYFCRNNRCSKR